MHEDIDAVKHIPIWVMGVEGFSAGDVIIAMLIPKLVVVDDEG
jgi:hypothetical protein